MKKLLTILFVLLMSGAVFSQTPTGFNYQAVIRNSSGQIMVNQNVALRVSIVSNDGLTTHYSEIHAVTSSMQGIVNIVVGSGTDKVGVLADVPWDKDQMKLKLEMKLGTATTYTLMGTQPLQAVPYALYANSVKEITSDPTATDEEPIFVVRNKDGKIVFAVYQGGVRVYVEDATTVKGAKGGFAVGGMSTQGKAGGMEYLRVTSDSTRVYIDTSSVKGAKGGFAVGGMSTQGKMLPYDILRVTSDSTRIYIDDNTKGAKGGFAVGGMSTQGKSNGINYFDVSTDAANTILTSQNRVLWFPLKNAFLVGRVILESPDSVGTNSFAVGYESKAIGDYSQAMGFRAISRGAYSTAIGKYALSQGNSSIAFGDNAKTAKNTINSFAIGRNTEANATNSFAFGNGAIASAVGSFAFGAGGRDSTGAALAGSTEASGLNSFAFGLGAKAQGINSFSIGTGTVTTNTGENAIAMGFGTTASGRFAFAMGFRNIASGRSSMAWGGMRFSNIELWNTASGDASTAWGFDTKATSYGSTSWGRSTSATNQMATAWGYYSEATGFAATAWGWSSKAYEHQATAWAGGVAVASHSTAAAWTKANAYMSMVIGRANDTIYTNSSQYYTSGKPTSYMDWVDKDPLFIVGNGWDHPAVGKRNALTVLKDGTTIVGWNMSVTNSTSNPDARYLLSVKNPSDAGYKFYVHGKAGGTEAWSSTSDSRMKKNIQTINNPLGKVLKLRGVNYEWIDENKPGKQIGFIAQEVVDVVPEVVTGTEQTTYSLQYAPVTALLVEAIKEQQKQIEELRAELEALKQLLKK